MPSATGSGALLALALSASAAGTATRLTAELDRSEVALGETVELTIRLESDEAPRQVELPADGPDLRVVGRRESTQTQMSFGGGAVQLRQARIWVLVLEPLRRGKVTVAGPAVTVGGERHRAPDLAVAVSGSAPRAAPSRPGAADDEEPAAGRSLSWRGWEKDLVLRVRLDRKEAFVGEQVTATVELLSPVEVVDWDAWRPPSLDGFWSEDLGAKPSRRVDRVDDIPVRVYTLKKLALFPHRAGAIAVEPAELEVRVQIASRDPLGLFPELRRARRRSRAVTLQVKPLPPGAPPGFAPGNVGDWSLSWEAPATRPPAGQPFPLRLVARGAGNLRVLTLPPVPPQPGLRTFDPSVSDEVKLEGERFAGARAVETLVALEREGPLTVPALEWPYFDPRSGRYRSARLPALPLEAGPPALAPRPAPADVASLATSLRPLRAEGALWPARGPAWRSPLLLAALAAPPALFAGLWLALLARDRMASGERERRRRRAARSARKRLAAARRRMEAGDAEGFHAEAARALHGYASDRLGRPVSGLTREALAVELTRAGAHGPAVGLLARTLEASDAGRFGGEARLPELLRSAEEAIARLEEAEWAPPGGRE